MDSGHEFLRLECANLDKTVAMIGRLLAKQELSDFEIIALGTLLQNVYMGIENILRFQLICRGVSLPKTESWHKDLLQRAHREGLLTDAQTDYFRDLLFFRHMHTHGYGHQLKEARL